MAEENTDIKNGELAKEPSDFSLISESETIPSSDTVAEAFATFEKEHHVPVSTSPQQQKVDATKIQSAPSAPEPVPPAKSVAPSASILPVQKVTQQEPPKVVTPAPAQAVQSAPTPTPAAPVVAPAPATVSPVHTPTPIAPASFPIAPVAPIEKPAPVSTPTPSTMAPVAEKSTAKPQVSPLPPSTEKKVPPTAKPLQTKGEKPAQPTMIESMRAESSSPLHPLRTLRSDVEDTVKERKTSIVSVVAAEENRRASGITTQSLVETPPQKKGRTVFFVTSALALLVLGGGLLVFTFMPKEVPIEGQPQLPASTLIFADEITELKLGEFNRTEVMSGLVALRENTALSLGLIREIYPTKIASTTNLSWRMEIAPLLQLIAPHASDEFLRTLNPNYVLGIHVFDGNQAFLILTTSAYEQTFAGMVAWEVNMRADLLPLFDRRPRPRTPTELLSTSTLPSVINTGFVDMVIENQDARVLKDADGNIVLLWTFINQNTLVITSNERTLAELVSRIRNAPTLGQ